MGGDTDRARCRLGRVRMLMRGECYCRPKGQHNAQARYPLRYRPHDGYPMEAFLESIPKRQTNATREYVDGYVSSTPATPTLHENSPLGTPNARPILCGSAKSSFRLHSLLSFVFHGRQR
jgi:hypothetical protein